MATSTTSDQFNHTLLGIDTLLTNYNTSPASRIMKEGLITFVDQLGYDALATLADAITTKIGTLARDPVFLSAGAVSKQIPVLGQNIHAVHGQLSGIPLSAFTYQWKRGGSNITGATSEVYQPVFADVGSILSCVITATNTHGNTTQTVTAAGNTVDDTGFPHNTVAPAVTGTATNGSTLTTTNGTWTGDATIVFTRQWFRDAVAVSGQTALTYVLGAGDVGHVMTCKVTGTNGKGAAVATSNATATVS